MNTLSLPNRIIVLSAVILLSVLIVFIAKLGIADARAYNSYRTLKAWQLAPFEMSNEEWTGIQNDLDYAHSYDPDNPELMMLAGLAHEGQFADDAIQLPAAQKAREQALTYYRQSVKLRPTWPYGWIDLALVKYRLGEVDDEFHNAIRNAAELGPWEPGVQRVIIDIGLHGWWSTFTKPDRVFTMDMISRAMEHIESGHSNQVLGIAEKYGFLNLVCTVKKQYPRVIDYCKKHQKK